MVLEHTRGWFFHRRTAGEQLRARQQGPGREQWQGRPDQPWQCPREREHRGQPQQHQPLGAGSGKNRSFGKTL